MSNSNDFKKNPVVEWFGDSFTNLDPLLQDLHQQGGKLTGVVTIEFGIGVSGLIGRRLANKIGLPVLSGLSKLEVSISHSYGALLWSRKFNDEKDMVSVFVPHGTFPDGFWSETTGPLALKVGVEIRDGGWFWIQRQIRFKGIPLPLWLFPSSHAYKRVMGGLYEFSVTFTLPVFGKLVSYGGLLRPERAANSMGVPI